MHAEYFGKTPDIFYRKLKEFNKQSDEFAKNNNCYIKIIVCTIQIWVQKYQM
jgi:hypothetical protein